MPRPTLIVNPVADEVFVSFAEMLVEHGVRLTWELERRLRSEYPRAAVHARLLSDERIKVWYVYRDGHWVNPRTTVRGRGDNEHVG